MASDKAGTGYVVLPDGYGSGPGVLVLHAWWGLTPAFKQLCDQLADAGFVALAPDLFHGRTAGDPETARALVEEADMDATAQLVLSSLSALRSMPATPEGPAGVVGYSMGASWALWLASRAADHVGATVVFYGAQTMDMSPATSPFLGHFAEEDDLVSEEELTLLEADLKLLDKEVTFHRYPGTGHWFAERDQPAHDPEAAALAWERTVGFLHQHLYGDAAGS